MRFTEREMTTAVDVVARQLFSATRLPWRKGRAEDAWRELAPMEKYQRRSAVGEAVLPALVALPERPTVGASPEFSKDEYAEAAEAASRSLLDQRRPGAWDELSEKKRARMVRATAALTRAAVNAMPIRQDPDALVVPDHL